MMKFLFVLAQSLALAAIPAAAATVYSTTLSGVNEVPATTSGGTGSAVVTITGNTLDLSVIFSGLSSPDSAAHIHCCGAVGVNEPVALPFTGFPVGVTTGTFHADFDLTDSTVYTAAFLSANGGTAASAETALLAGLGGNAYVNIHTTTNPGGEIRGQLAAVPEPFTAGLALLSLSAMAFWRRRVSGRA